MSGRLDCDRLPQFKESELTILKLWGKNDRNEVR